MPEGHTAPGAQALPAPLLALRRQYLAKLPDRLTELQVLWDRWLASGGSDAQARESLHQCVHKLTGAAGTFGLPEVSVAARALEQRVVETHRADGGGRVSPPAQMAQAHRDLQAIGRAACAPLLSGEHADARQHDSDSPGVAAAGQRPAGAGRTAPWRVLLVDDDALLLEAHATLLREAGMAVMTLDQPDRTLAAVRSFEPDVLLLDVYMPGISGPELAATLRREESLVRAKTGKQDERGLHDGGQDQDVATRRRGRAITAPARARSPACRRSS